MHFIELSDNLIETPSQTNLMYEFLPTFPALFHKPMIRFLPKSRISHILFSLFFLLLVSNSFSQVGINTTDPKTTLDINGSIALREGPALTLGNGANNDISLGTSPYSFYRITGPTATFSITGIVPATGADGQIVILQNTTSQSMTIAHQTGSTATNQIFVPAAKNLTLRGSNTTITLQYNASLSKWILLDKYNHIETWYHGPININAGANIVTVIIPEASQVSGAFVNFAGTIPPATAASLSITYVETQANQVVFKVNNSSGSTINNVSFVITLNKI